MKLDSNNWIIGNDGTYWTDWAETIDGADRIYGIFGNFGINGTDWAETIDGADRTYRTLGKLIITLGW